MFKLFISKDSLTDLYFNHAAAPTDWLKVIQKQRKLFLMNDEGDIDSDLSDPNSMLSLFLTAIGKSFDIFEPSSISISDIQDDPARVLENPCGCYLLDIDKAEAESIQKNYGVICQSTNDYQDCPLVFEEFPISPCNGEKGYGWDRFKSFCSKIPSNSIVINDRNLFSNQSEHELHGLENVGEILKAILPDALNTAYHVGIIFGSEKGKPNIGTPHNFEEIAKKLNSIKQKLNRPYPIYFSLLMLNDQDGTNWEKTHNRRIISNYYLGIADLKIAAFWKGRSLCSQTINFVPLYCKGLNNGADAPEKDHSQTIEGYQFMVYNWHSDPKNRFASGLNTDTASIENINHRLLT